MAKTKKQNEFQRTLRAKRKKSFLEILGNIIIWTSPAILMLIVIILDWEKMKSAPTGIKIQAWVIVGLFIMLLIYYKWIKRAIHDKIQEKNINAEKTGPLLCLSNSILALLPYVFAILVFNFFNELNEPISKFLIVILLCEAFGRLLLFIDSFSEARYK